MWDQRDCVRAKPRESARSLTPFIRCDAGGGVLVGDCARGLPRTQKVSSRVIELLDRCLHLPLARQGAPQWAAQEEQQARELQSHLRNIGIKAVEERKINLSQDQRTFTWASNDRKLMNVPFDEHPYSALAAWFKTDEGMEIYSNIEKRLN